jgi:uncharacterized phage-associated protein
MRNYFSPVTHYAFNFDYQAMETALQTTLQLIALSWDKRIPPTHDKLQAMLFYLQGWAKVLHGEWYFSDGIETTGQGPLVRTVFDEYGYFGRRPIAPEQEIASTDDLLPHVIVETYGKKNDVALKQLAYEDALHFNVADQQQMSAFFANPERLKTTAHAEFIDLFQKRKYNVIHWQPPVASASVIAELEELLLVG